MLGRYFELYGIPCGLCDLPAHHCEVYPNGIRTVHVDLQQRSCDSVGTARPRQPDRRGSEKPTVLRRAPAPVRVPTRWIRRSA